MLEFVPIGRWYSATQPCGEVATVTGKAQRGPLLSSVVMVMLATVATGLLAFIGFQALPDSLIPAVVGGGDHPSRRVRVSDSPTPTPTVAPTTVAPTTNPPSSGTAAARSSAPGTSATPAVVTHSSSAPGPTKKPVAKPTKSPTPKPTPTPSMTTQAPTPAPTCGSRRCPSPNPSQNAGPAAPNGSRADVGESTNDDAADSETAEDRGNDRHQSHGGGSRGHRSG
ncbi:MAG: hypothetical protein QOE45_1749 [Frankiaceae bacterium]|nr:hypothetical protein [Frankiaceae bacterium]